MIVHHSKVKARQFRHDLANRHLAVQQNCTRDTLRCADARLYTTDLRECCRGHIRQIVTDTARVLNDLGITFWADYGTLLGAVRNPLLGMPAGIIPHDKDADFGLLGVTETRLNRVARALRDLQYRVNVRSGVRHGARDRFLKMKVQLSAANHTNADFFCWFEKPAGTLTRFAYLIPGVDRYKGKDFPKKWVESLPLIPWEDISLPAPADAAAFCAFRYGPNWMTPIRANNDGVVR